MGSDASVCFSWAGKGENVHVAGTWDHWQTPGLQLRKYVDDFHLSEVCLPSGIHEVRSCYATPCFLNKGPARSPDALSSSSLSVACGVGVTVQVHHRRQLVQLRQGAHLGQRWQQRGAGEEIQRWRRAASTRPVGRIPP